MFANWNGSPQRNDKIIHRLLGSTFANGSTELSVFFFDVLHGFCHPNCEGHYSQCFFNVLLSHFGKIFVVIFFFNGILSMVYGRLYAGQRTGMDCSLSHFPFNGTKNANDLVNMRHFLSKCSVDFAKEKEKVGCVSWKSSKYW